MFYVYILKCGDGTLYCGYTNNVEKRIEAHRSGKGAKYTKGRLPLELVHTETFAEKGDALRREAEIKKMPKKEKLKLIEKEL